MEELKANERQLATVAKILDIQPIEDAENIEMATIRGWHVVVKKGEFSIGDLCIYVEVGSVMPDGLPEDKAEEWKALHKLSCRAVTPEERDIYRAQMAEVSKLNTKPEFEFLRQSKFRIKTKKIFEQISQGICFPLSILESLGNFQSVIGDPRWNTVFILSGDEGNCVPIIENEDLTELLGVIQYVEPDPASMGGDAKGELEAVGILMSDEQRIENLSSKWEQLRKLRYVVSEKLEGASASYFLKNGEFGVCSRSLNLKESEFNTFWKVARKEDIESKMRQYAYDHNLTNWNIQGELVGEGIQGNIYKLKGQTVKLYNLFDIDTQQYLDPISFIEATKEMGIGLVPIIDDDYELPETIEQLFAIVDNFYTIFGNNPKQLAEGWVLVAKGDVNGLRITRSAYNRLSWKAKSRTYDLNK